MLTPVKKMRETSENLPKPSKNLPLAPKIKTLAKTSAKTVSFFEPISGVATPQPSASNPDRSPVAQWLKMRISPASCLPAPWPLPPGLCLQGSIQNPCPARRRRKAPCSGEGFQKSQYWPKFPYIKNPCPVQGWRQALCGGEGLQKSHYWPEAGASR